MCIVADDVEDVSKTKIVSFNVAYSFDEGKTTTSAQLVIYSANVDSKTKSNALILPIYNPGNDYKKIIPLDFSELPKFIEDIDHIYSRWFPKVRNNSAQSMTNSFADDSETLEVYTVGNYKFSIMPDKYDFDRLDISQLNINPQAKISINAHSDDYSFIVYQFYERGNIDVTPFGYLCPLYKENEMVIPTIHGHPHDDINNLGGLGYVTNIHVKHQHNFENIADYDHTIYVLTKTTEDNAKNTGKDVRDMGAIMKNIQTDYMKRRIRVYIPHFFIPSKYEIKGKQYNRNILLVPGGWNFINDLVVG